MSAKLKATLPTAFISRFKNPLVVGLGTTGFSVVRYLHSRGLVARVVDTRQSPPNIERLEQEYPTVETSFGAFDSVESQAMFANADLIVVNPGLSLATNVLAQARRRGVPVVVDIELFLQENTQDIIAITGTNGKTTVTTLVGELLAASGAKPLVAGNIGTSPLDALTDSQDYDFAVLELSSFQLEGISSLGARVATILNISPDHMDRYASVADYTLAKTRIFRGAKAAVLPRYFEALQQVTVPSNTTYFGLDKPSKAADFGVIKTSKDRWLVKGKTRLVAVSKINLLGRHNLCNVLAALALLDHLGVEPDRLTTPLASFNGLAHRMERVAVIDGITWINDSKATNEGAALAAINSLDGPIIWLAGGDAKGVDFADLGRQLNKNIKAIITFGRDGDLIARAVGDAFSSQSVESLEQAVICAQTLAAAGDAVLLSPACASFDQFKNYAERGETFKSLVTSAGGAA